MPSIRWSRWRSYAIAEGRPDAGRLIAGWRVTAVLTRNRNGVADLERRGFVLRDHNGEGYYLVSPGGDCGSGRQALGPSVR